MLTPPETLVMLNLREVDDSERLLLSRHRTEDMIMRRRTSALQWFDGLIIELTEHESPEIIFAFSEEHKSALDRLDYTDKQQEAENKGE